jgi:hypothetical protein
MTGVRAIDLADKLDAQKRAVAAAIVAIEGLDTGNTMAANGIADWLRAVRDALGEVSLQLSRTVT